MASGTTTRACSRTIRRNSVPPWMSLATRRLRTDIGGAHDRHEQALVVARFLRRDHVVEAAGLLERFDELIDVLRSPRLDRDADDELPLLGQRRIHRRN